MCIKYIMNKCNHVQWTNNTELIIRNDVIWSHSLHRCHNEPNGVWNHLRLDCLLNRLFRRRLQKTSKLRVTGLCEGNSPVAGEFPAQRASNMENVSIWWRRHETCMCMRSMNLQDLIVSLVPNHGMPSFVLGTFVSAKYLSVGYAQGEVSCSPYCLAIDRYHRTPLYAKDINKAG